LGTRNVRKSIKPSKEAMSNPQAACTPVEGFVWPSLGFHCSKSILDIDNLSFFDNLEFDIFDAGGPQCHFITSFTIAIRIQTLSVH